MSLEENKALVRVANGQLVEHWSTMDTAALYQQLGAIKLPKGS